MNLYEAITAMSQERLELFVRSIESMVRETQSKETGRDNTIGEVRELKAKQIVQAEGGN